MITCVNLAASSVRTLTCRRIIVCIVLETVFNHHARLDVQTLLSGNQGSRRRSVHRTSRPRRGSKNVRDLLLFPARLVATQRVCFVEHVQSSQQFQARPGRRQFFVLICALVDTPGRRARACALSLVWLKGYIHLLIRPNLHCSVKYFSVVSPNR